MRGLIGRLMVGREGQARFSGKVLTLLLGGFFFANAIGQAQDVDWANVTGSPDPWFHEGGNWAGGVAPLATDTVHFDQAGAYEVWWDDTTATTTPEVSFLEITDGEVTLLNTGDELQHELLLRGVRDEHSNVIALEISGSNSTLINRGLHLFGFDYARILDGGTLTLDGSHLLGAKLTAEGLGLLNGILNIEAGGKVVNSWESHVATVNIAGARMATATATVTGAGSEWITRDLYVRQGRVNIEAGGVVNTKNSTIGEKRDNLIPGIGRVTGAGSEWNTESSLIVGYRGNGILEIDKGGVVSSAYINIGFESDLTRKTASLLTVSGRGSKLLASDWTHMGFYGHGTLRIEDAGYASSYGVTIGSQAGGTGLVEVIGIDSKFEVSGELRVGGEGQGTVRLEGGTIRAATLDSSLGTLEWTSGELDVDNFIGNLVQDAGTFSVGGNSSGKTVITGDYELSDDGALAVELAAISVARGDLGLLEITGNATLGGTLDVSLATGFVPTVGDEFEFLVAADVTNTFENVNLPTLPSEMSWSLTYATESVLLTAVAVPEPGTILLAVCAMAGLVLRCERV